MGEAYIIFQACLNCNLSEGTSYDGVTKLKILCLHCEFRSATTKPLKQIDNGVWIQRNPAQNRTASPRGHLQLCPLQTQNHATQIHNFGKTGENAKRSTRIGPGPGRSPGRPSSGGLHASQTRWWSFGD